MRLVRPYSEECLAPAVECVNTWAEKMVCVSLSDDSGAKVLLHRGIKMRSVFQERVSDDPLRPLTSPEEGD